MLKKIINNAKEYSLSDLDIKKALNNECKIVLYEDLKNFKDIDKLLAPLNCVIVLYELHGENSGHWIFIQKNKHNLIEFFDSYGGKPDSYIYNKRHWRQKENNGKIYPYLTELLFNSPYRVIYNKFNFQKLSPKIATCGRHVILRAKLRDIPLHTYIKIFKNDNVNLTRDEIVTLLTEMLI